MAPQYREENEEVYLVQDKLGNYHLAVRHIRTRLFTLNRWVDGSFEKFTNRFGKGEVIIFFKSDGIRHYVREGEWVLRSSDNPESLTVVSNDELNRLYKKHIFRSTEWFNFKPQILHGLI